MWPGFYMWIALYIDSIMHLCGCGQVSRCGLVCCMDWLFCMNNRDYEEKCCVDVDFVNVDWFVDVDWFLLFNKNTGAMN